MANGIRITYSNGLYKGFGSMFCVGSRVRHETPEEDRRMHRPKRYEYNNKDDNNSLNTLNDKSYQASSRKFKQIICIKNCTVRLLGSYLCIKTRCQNKLFLPHTVFTYPLYHEQYTTQSPFLDTGPPAHD